MKESAGLEPVMATSTQPSVTKQYTMSKSLPEGTRLKAEPESDKQIQVLYWICVGQKKVCLSVSRVMPSISHGHDIWVETSRITLERSQRVLSQEFACTHPLSITTVLLKIVSCFDRVLPVEKSAGFLSMTTSRKILPWYYLSGLPQRSNIQ